jgi:hypothetical protein
MREAMKTGEVVGEGRRRSGSSLPGLTRQSTARLT